MDNLKPEALGEDIQQIPFPGIEKVEVDNNASNIFLDSLEESCAYRHFIEELQKTGTPAEIERYTITEEDTKNPTECYRKLGEIFSTPLGYNCLLEELKLKEDIKSNKEAEQELQNMLYCYEHYSEISSILEKLFKQSIKEIGELSKQHPEAQNLAEIIKIYEEKISKFSLIRQGIATNSFTKLKATEGKGLTIDQITGDATVKNGNFILTIPKYEQLTGLKTSTYQLLDAITVALTESGAKSPTVILPLEEYMKRRGLKDRKEAKTQAKADMEILRGASFSWEEKRKKKVESYAFINLADSGEIRRNGDIVFTYGNTFYNILLGYPVMPYPAQLQTLNSKRNPNSYYLLRKIAEHKNMNIGKKNENIIAVKTLLSVAPFLPTYEEVIETDKHLDQRIIKPFERDMDALETTLSWNYCHSLDQPLTDEELNTMSYATFEGLMIHTEWRSYPDQTARLERKAKAMAQAQQKKKRTPSKKKKPAEE